MFKQNAQPAPQSWCGPCPLCSSPSSTMLWSQAQQWGCQGVYFLNSRHYLISLLIQSTWLPPSFDSGPWPKGRRMLLMTSRFFQPLHFNLFQPLHFNLNNQSIMAPSRNNYQHNKVPFYGSPVSAASSVEYCLSRLGLLLFPAAERSKT